MLSDYFHCKMVFLHLYVGTSPHGFHQSSLYFGSRIVGMVQYAELRVAALTVQIEFAFVITVEVNPPLHQLTYLTGGVAHHLLHGPPVADVVAGYHCIFYVLVEIVESQVGHRCYSALRE